MKFSKILPAVLAFLLFSCSGQDPVPSPSPDPEPNPGPATEIPVESLTLKPVSLTLAVGDTRQLTLTLLPENATDKRVKWSSSDSGVASVDKDGKVTAVSVGKARITVMTFDDELGSTCSVTVTEASTGPDTDFSLEEDIDEYVFTYELGSVSLPTAGKYFDWVAESNADWLEVRKTPTGAAPKLTMYVQKYGEGRITGWGDSKDSPRSAEVTIYNQDKSKVIFKLPVYQDPYPYIAAGECKVSPDGGEYLYRIKANCRRWTCITELQEYDKANYDNSWLQAGKAPEGKLSLKVAPWNTDLEKPKPAYLTIEYRFNGGGYIREHVTVSYYDPSASGEHSEYGDGGPWD